MGVALIYLLQHGWLFYRTYHVLEYTVQCLLVLDAHGVVNWAWGPIALLMCRPAACHAKVWAAFKMKRVASDTLFEILHICGGQRLHGRQSC